MQRDSTYSIVDFINTTLSLQYLMMISLSFAYEASQCLTSMAINRLPPLQRAEDRHSEVQCCMAFATSLQAWLPKHTSIDAELTQIDQLPSGPYLHDAWPVQMDMSPNWTGHRR